MLGFLLLLAGDCLCRALAGAGIGVGTLATNGQAATMTQATIVAQVHQPLDVHRDVAAKITLDDVIPVDGLTDLDDFRVGELVDTTLRGNANLGADILGELVADPVDILQRDDNALICRDIDASNTCHVCSPSFSAKDRKSTRLNSS